MLEYLQNYWWLLVSVLGGILVFLLFVQGGQSMLLSAGSKTRRDLIVNSMGSKWELTFISRFRLFPSLLFHKLRRSILALDSHSLQLYSPGCQL